MSLRIAVALAVTIGAGTLMSSAAEARPDMVGFRGDYSPGTIVVKTNERRLYLVLDPDHAMRYPVGVGKSRQAMGRHHPDRRQVPQSGMVAAGRSEARQAVDARTSFPAARRTIRWASPR